MRLKPPKRSTAFFVLTVIVLSALATGGIKPVWADQYVGYANPSNTCSNVSLTCTGCNGACVSNPAIGEGVQAPFTGTLISASFQTGAITPHHVDIFTFPVGTTPVMFSGNYVCGQSPQSNQCKETNGGNVWTLQDRESLTGLAAQSFFTVVLANSVSVTKNQWVLIAFEGNNGQNGWLGSISSGGSTNFMDTGINVVNILNGQTDTDTTTIVIPGGMPVGGTFSTSASTTITTTQCYGNCGTPPVTLVNTNSTHLLPFNQSITLFYEAQSNINGFIQNVTVSMARGYTNGQNVFIGIYTIPSCPFGNTPFSTACPAVLGAQTNIVNPSKGKATLTITKGSLSISNGQWMGIAYSAQFAPFDLNDTNTNVQMFQVNGIMPAVISNQVSTSTCACATGVWAFVTGNIVTGGGPTTPIQPGCSGLDCILTGAVNSFCGTVTAACQTGASLFWIIILTIISFGSLLVISNEVLPGANVARMGIGELGLLIFMAWIVIFTSFNLLSVYVLILVFFSVSILFGKRVQSYI